MCHLSNNKGFSLIEVLVAVVILAIGLLAAASMQTTAMTATTTSRNTTLAVQLAEEMVDRIRVNAGNITPENNIYNNLVTGSCTSISNTTALGDCNQWRDRLQSSGLPGPTGTVSVTPNSPIVNAAKITVEVSWGTIGVKRMKVITIMEARVS